ncbi:MAG TPA: hypothetical protein VF176_08715 [Solirubrobacterales bacterium]
MKLRLPAVSMAVLATGLILASSASAAMIGIYRNGLGSLAQRSEMVKLSGRDCERSGFNEALRIVVGKRTKECSFRTPVLGRDLEIAATERLLSGTPKKLRHGTFLGVQLRAGGGARYQLAVYPFQRKVQLRKILDDGTVKYLAIVKNEAAVRGIDQANKLRLSAINAEPGLCRLRAYLGRKQVAEAIDARAGELDGRASGVSIGSSKGANGAAASIDDIVVRVPNPF